jgi:hypothetical protein
MMPRVAARLVRRYDFEVLDANKFRRVARLTTCPARQILRWVRRRYRADHIVPATDDSPAGYTNGVKS